MSTIPGVAQRVLFILLFSLLSAIRLFFKLRYKAINLKPVTKSEGRTAGIVRIVLGMPLLFATYITCFAPDLVSWMHIPVSRIASILSFLAGILILTGLVLVHLHLGESFSTSIESTNRQRRLITTGPYRYVRHPMYSLYFALFLSAFGVSGNLIVGLCGVGIIASMMIFRVPKEEQLLTTYHQNAYLDYADSTPRYLPLVRVKHRSYEDGSLGR